MDTHTTRRTLAAMHDRLGGDHADSGATQASPLHRMGMLFLAFLVVISMPMFWASTAQGDDSDAPSAPLTGKSGSSDDDDEDEDEDEDSTDGNGRSDGVNDTGGTDGAGDTRGTVNTDRGAKTVAGSATDGANDTKGTDGAGDTQGTVNTDRGDDTDRH